MNPRIAVLLTNDDTSAFAAHFPNDGQKVVQLLQPLRPDWSYEVVAVKDGNARLILRRETVEDLLSLEVSGQ